VHKEPAKTSVGKSEKRQRNKRKIEVRESRHAEWCAKELEKLRETTKCTKMSGNVERESHKNVKTDRENV
jgi:hypothetical protein